MYAELAMQSYLASLDLVNDEVECDASIICMVHDPKAYLAQFNTEGAYCY